MYGSVILGSNYYGQGYPALTVGVPIWVSPANHATGINQIATFVFIIPEAQAPLHFEIQVDSSSSFTSPSIYKSWLTQSGWEYYDGASWQAIPSTGIPQTYAGNQARYTPSTSLSPALWYRRIRGRVRI